jgi:peptidoglycan/LPS O-acetylase OafA/YrhL
VLGNLGFLESFKPLPLLGWQVEVMPDNLNLWSLNFEALYYLAFLAVWWLAPRAGWVIFAVGAVAAAGFAGNDVMASSYALGALYWVAGLSAAWLAAGGAGPGNWPSAVLSAVAICRLAPLGHVLRLAHIPNTVEPLPIPSLHMLDLLPAMAWLLLAVTGRGGRWVRWLGASCLAWACVGLALAFRAGDGGEPGAMACYAAAVVLGWALFRWEPAPSALARLAPLGAVSYGVYAVGFPIQFGIFSSHWIPEGSAVTYALRAALLAGLTFGLAWILERKLQPALRRALGGGRPPGAIAARDRPNSSA